MGALRNKREGQWLKEAGELLPVEAIDRTGLTVTTEGAFVRILQITPPNPLILSEEERLGIARGYCRMVSRLRASQSLQFYVEARPMNLGEILSEARREVGFTAGPPPSSLDTEGADPLATSRWAQGRRPSRRARADIPERGT